MVAWIVSALFMGGDIGLFRVGNVESLGSLLYGNDMVSKVSRT